MRNYIPFLVFILLAKITIAQSISTLMGAPSNGLGNASSGSSNEWSLFNNPGGLGKIDQMNAAFAFEAQSKLKAANRMAAVFNYPGKPGTLSAGIFRFGDDLYNEQVLSFGFGNQLGIASLGVKANLIQYQSTGLGSYHALSLDFGGISKLSEKLLISAYITNLTQSSIGNDGATLPTHLTVGITFNLENNVLITSELSKELDYMTTWRTGLEYAVYQKVIFRTGFNLNPNAAFFGLGVIRNKIRIDFSSRFNQLTGSSHQASASYWFSQSKKDE